MSLEDVADFVRAHRLSAEAAEDLRELVARVASEAKHTSTLGTLDLLSELTLDDSAAEPPRIQGVDRYEDLGLLGEGGMGEVRRVRDRDLNRVMAMKVIPTALMEHPAVLARFVEEAQCSAQLQHPGIVPVHALGRLKDGRVYFTMREVRGRTLSDVIAEVHAASRERWESGASGWTFRRLVDAFVKVCEAVGYAHARGVVHRDLKPANVMLGEHGEVLVLDWGLAKVRGLRDRVAEAGDLDVVITDRSSSGGPATRIGAVAGTPAYMPPEQARGEVDRIDARSDVYALGAVLYEILAGRPPYEGPSGQAVLRMVLAGPPDPPGQAGRPARDTWSYGPESLEEPARGGPPLAEELAATCLRAMAREPHERHDNAAELAVEVTSWLEGARRRERALEVVVEAAALGPAAAALRAQVDILRAEAARLLLDVKVWEPEERMALAWAKEDEAAALERRSEALDLESEQRLIGALQIDPAAPEAHEALAERHGAAHAVSEQARDDRGVAREEALLRAHAARAAPAVAHRWGTYLKGDGALSLVTDPPGAEVDLFRYETRNRRLVPVFERSLGATPLRAVPISMGSYLCVVQHPLSAAVRYPVCIGRAEHWDGVAPATHHPHAIPLPRRTDLAADDCYVPSGWFWSGGDPDSGDVMPRRRLWCEGIVFRRFPITNREYIAFLDDLVGRGREAEALRWAPRERAGLEGQEGTMNYGRDAHGHFVLVADDEGDIWLPDWPVVNVHFGCAEAFARWSAARTGQRWRLPAELEWEKAARGVDGRFFPWGDAFTPSWCNMRDSQPARPLPAGVDTYPVDESVYGVRGLGGNVEDWCADLYTKEGPSLGDRIVEPAFLGNVNLSPSSRRAKRGGSWTAFARNGRCCNRVGYEPLTRGGNIGIRLVKSYPPKPMTPTGDRGPTK